MKILKKILMGVIGGVIIPATLCGLTACSANISDNNIAETVNNSVTYPEQYSITYEVEASTGVVRTITKTVDADGNVYFVSGETEKLYIKDGESYEIYERDDNGVFTVTDEQTAYNRMYVDSDTAEFISYAEQSKKQFIPGMESIGEEEILGRTCLVYGVVLGNDNTGISYSFYVDKETGICLGFDSDKSAAGFELGTDGEVFICTEFITEDVASLTGLLP